MTLKIFVVRHGETEWNQKRLFQGQQNSVLTVEGRSSALVLQKKIAKYEFNAVYSSPSLRAYDTAKILIDNHEYIQTDYRLLEISLGDWEGLSFDFVKANYPKLYKNYKDEPHLFDGSLIRGESLQDIKNRVAEFLNDIAFFHKKGNILVVCHGGTINAILNYVLERNIDKFWYEKNVENLSVLELCLCTDGKFKLINDNVEFE
ncbi:MAG: histidine phosphatase family protein [Candidatus Delongbacteria bacterium]|nr:histidine phosphatase family protein [Candidatus Delongbacteria bacterium]MBN2836077.1 histidine phosphatase family protein [Candidatus Delongbacteria bacterium]